MEFYRYRVGRWYETHWSRRRHDQRAVSHRKRDQQWVGQRNCRIVARSSRCQCQQSMAGIPQIAMTQDCRGPMLSRRQTWRGWIAFTAVVAAAGCGGTDGTAPATASAIALVSGNHQTGTVGQLLGQPLIVRVTDKNGAGVSGVAVSWAITAGSGALSAASSQTDAQGQTQVSWTLGTSAGSEKDTAFASVGGVNGTALFGATASPGPPALLTMASGDGQTGLVGQTLAQAVVVAASDQYGNVTSGVSVA